MHGWWGYEFGRGPGMFIGWLAFLFVLAVLALVVWLIVRLVRSSASKRAQTPGAAQIAQPDPVLETLRRRLAEGAITTQEFDELKEKLGV